MDMEKVIKGIDICLQRFRCGEYCPYYNTEKIVCMEQLREDALAMLKEQEEEIENLKQTTQSMMEVGEFRMDKGYVAMIFVFALGMIIGFTIGLYVGFLTRK